MSRRIIRDIEEALSREVRRIVFDQERTTALTVLEDVFDPFSGELVSQPVEPSFYDSSADTNTIQYPHFFIRLLKSREDRYTGRVVPVWGRNVWEPVNTSPVGYNIIVSDIDGSIPSVGNTLYTSSYQIRKIQPGFLLRVLQGSDIGTYTVDHIVPSDVGNHQIVVNSQLVVNLPTILFDSLARTVVFTSSVDLNTVNVGDIFTDSTNQTFNVLSVDIHNGSIDIAGSAIPSLLSGGTITRSGNIFQTSSVGPLFYVVMDPSQPVFIQTEEGLVSAHDQSRGTSPKIPIDLYYLVRIDSKERDTHVDVLNRMWEEFNPPRTGLPVIVRTKHSAEQLLTQSIQTGGNSIVNVADTSTFNLNDPVFIFDDLLPTKLLDQTFSRPFESKVIGILSTNQLQLQDIVPDNFTTANNSKIVSNAYYYIHMFHFVDHATKDIESAQYWSHDFTFWIQVFVDRLEEAEVVSDIHAAVVNPEEL